VYYCRRSYGELARQYWRYGIAKAGVLRKHPERLRWRHLAPSTLVAALVTLRALSAFSRRIARLHGLVAGAYAVFCTVASLQIATKGRHWRIFPLIPLAFPCIHLPAGAGLIYGFVMQVTHRADAGKLRLPDEGRQTAEAAEAGAEPAEAREDARDG
jgi:hypothetical protein